MRLYPTLTLAAAMVALAAPAGAQPRTYSLTLYDQPDYRGGSATFYEDNANIGSTGFASRARSAQVRGTWRVCEGGGYRNRCEVLSGNVRDLSAYGLSGRVGSAQFLGPDQAAAAPAPPPPAPAPRPYAEAYRPAPPEAAPYGRAEPYVAPSPRGDAYAQAPYRAPDRGVDRRDRFEPAPYSPDDARVRPDDRRGWETPPAPPPARKPYATPLRSYDEAVEGDSAVFFPRPTLRGEPVSAWNARAADRFCRAQRLGPAIYFDQSQRAGRAVDVDGRWVGEGPVLGDVLCRRY